MNKSKMTRREKIGGWFIEKFVMLFETALYCIALPLGLGTTLVIQQALVPHPAIFIITSLFVGVFLKTWMDERRSSAEPFARLPFHTSVVKWVRSNFEKE